MSKDFSDFGPNAGLVKDLYNQFLIDERLVDGHWVEYFSKFKKDSFLIDHTNSNSYFLNATSASSHQSLSSTQEKVTNLINNFRSFGHLKADINPLSSSTIKKPLIKELEVEKYEFSDSDMDSSFSSSGFKDGKEIKLSSLIEQLNQTYCSKLGFEYTHILDSEERLWIQNKIENRFKVQISNESKKDALKELILAENFEDQLHKKYIGSKRFSCEGGETFIPMLSNIIDKSNSLDVSEIVIGMAHRGRLNVLRNIFKKPLAEMFSEFEDKNLYTKIGSGDVKYHLGYENIRVNSENKKLYLSLVPNPSHLEFVNPVAEGIVRAKQDLFFDKNPNSVIPVLIHGDAAFIGQGVVCETLNLSLVKGYQTGGSIHLIINNQIGFTTTPDESRSSMYCSDFAKAIGCPIIHINCEDVESAIWASEFALEYRLKFNKDVVLDLNCWRKYGHNEGDEPKYTQPSLYKEVANKNLISKTFSDQLISQNIIDQGFIDNVKENISYEFKEAKKDVAKFSSIGDVCTIFGKLKDQVVSTTVSTEILTEIAKTLVQLPTDFTPNPKLYKLLESKYDAVKKGANIDWGLAESLAFGSLVLDNVSIRLSGQDCGRGTFSQRHLELTDYKTDKSYFPFSKLETGSTKFEIINSTLSEAGVLGFEFGYSSVSLDKTLVLWEAQFGDFVNGAQVIIDQFISSSEQKWHQLSGVTLMLPHGYEGQGPEHSSSRFERFLQLTADDNMRVVHPSSAAQHFHILRSQGLAKVKRPLVLITPKSLLRLPEAAADIKELSEGGFNKVISEDFSSNIKNQIFTSGKIYYEVKKALIENNISNVRLTRIEQYYPFPKEDLKSHLTNSGNNIWIQEEPINMGAWSFLEPYFRNDLELAVICIARARSASTATGSPSHHKVEQNDLINSLIEVLNN